MIECPATILGGLPIIVQMSFSRGDGWTTDDDFEVVGIFWIKRDGTRGKPVSQKIWDRAEKEDFLFCGLYEQVNDWIDEKQSQTETKEGELVCLF